MKVFTDPPNSKTKRKRNLSADGLQRYFKLPVGNKSSPRSDSSSDTYSWSPLSSSRSHDTSSLGSNHGLAMSYSEPDQSYRRPSGDFDIGYFGLVRTRTYSREVVEESEEIVSVEEPQHKETNDPLTLNLDFEKMKTGVTTHKVWGERTTTTRTHRLAFRLQEAKRVPQKQGYFFVVKLKSLTDTEVEWATPLSYGVSRVTFDTDPAVMTSPSLSGVVLVVQMWKHKKVPRLVGETTLALEVFPVNGLICKEVALFKETTVSLQLTIVALDILPNIKYMPFVLSLVNNNLSIAKKLLHTIGETSQITSLVHILNSVDCTWPLIDQALCDELNNCDSLESLFREDNPNTALLDAYIQIVGQKYLLHVLKPFVQQLIKERPVCDIENETNKEELAKNIHTITELMKKLVDLITDSDDACPHALRVVLRKVYTFSMAKWPRNLDGWVTAVTGFLFLRFFVPALLHPCDYQLCQPWELRYQEKTTLMNTGIILQKMANLVLFQPGPNNFHLLNTSIQLGSFVIYQWVTALCHTEPVATDSNQEDIEDCLGYNSTLLAQFCLDNTNTFLRLGEDGKTFLDIVEGIACCEQRLVEGELMDEGEEEEAKLVNGDK